MHVMIMTAVFPPEIRSAAQLMCELSETLVRRGHFVTVLTSKSKGLLPSVSEHRGVRVIRIPTLAVHRSHAPASMRGIGQILNCLLYFVTALFVRHVEVTLAYSPPLALGLVGALLYRVKGIPHVLNVQDLVPQYAIDLGVLKSRLLIRLLKRLEHAIYRNVQLISVHSPGNAEYMIAEGVPVEKVAVVPNWVDAHRLQDARGASSYRRKAALEGKFVALFGGLLGFAQDVDTIVEAGALLRDHPNIALVIVGEGVEKARLIRKAQELAVKNVHFLPGVSNEKYPSVLAAADICLATLQKSLQCPVVPSKLLGYMAAGRPIIAAFPLDGDAPRVVQEAGCGVCVPPGDPERLAKAIIHAAANPSLCRLWGENGRRFVLAHHDLEQVVARYDWLMEGLLGSVPPTPGRSPLEQAAETQEPTARVSGVAL